MEPKAGDELLMGLLHKNQKLELANDIHWLGHTSKRA
jgi:hypothetical protein